MEKITVIINGVGGCGKDTLVEMLSSHRKVKNISSITPVKKIAEHCGWLGEKTDKARKFLSDLKKKKSSLSNAFYTSFHKQMKPHTF